MRFLGTLLLLFLSTTCFADSGAANDALRQQIRTAIVDKVIVLRNFYAANDLEYRLDGTLKHSSIDSGPWTVYGVIRPEQVDVSDREIKIRGSRLVVTFPNKNSVPTYGIGKKVTIEIDRDSNADPMDAVGKVFVAGNDKLSDVAPAFWRHFLRYREAHKEVADWAEYRKAGIVEERGLEFATPLSTSAEAGGGAVATPGRQYQPITNVNDPARSKVYRVGGGVSAPRAISTPDPKYNEDARQGWYEGTCVLWLIVDTDGRPQHIQITRPIGFGLDDEAVAAVEKWRFAPAMLDGFSVPVQINVEVNFHLYKR